MEAMNPHGALLTLCIARLPDGAIPRHAWAAEVLVEQLWACSVSADHEKWRAFLAPLIIGGRVNSRRLRSEVWALAQNGALEPAGSGREAYFTVTPEAVQKSWAIAPLACSDQDVITRAVDQLTARLFTSSK